MNIHAYPIYAPLKNPLAAKIANVKPQTLAALDLWMKRIHSVVEVIKRADAYSMVDAEQTFIQYTIDSVTRQLQRIYNNDKVVIMNTFQAYLKRTKRNVGLEVLACKMRGKPYGSKLVRGAYGTEENKIALEQQVESPVFPNKMLVDKSYNDIVQFVIKNVPPHSHFTVASHNETTLELALAAVEDRKKELEVQKSQISFAQLRGLSDNLTYHLAQTGHYTFKYMPYGPIENLAPYLFRRAEEASYIWLEGQKKLVHVRHELFDVRKFHYKFFGALGGIVGLIALI